MKLNAETSPAELSTAQLGTLGTSEQHADVFLQQTRPKSAPTMPREELVSHTRPAMDLKAVAKESMLWLDELPDQERTAAMVSMQGWVNSQGLDWDLWCEQSNHAMTGPPCQSNSLGATEPVFNPVPSLMQAYNTQIKSRPGTTSARELDLRLSGQNTDEEWHQLALEAVMWLQSMTKQDRPAAMEEMRRWVMQSGLSWDGWWGYCCYLQDGADAIGIAKGQAARRPGSQGKQRSFRGIYGNEAAIDENARRRRLDAEKKARDDLYRAQAEVWESKQRERVFVECHNTWKTSVREYAKEVLAD